MDEKQSEAPNPEDFPEENPVERSITKYNFLAILAWLSMLILVLIVFCEYQSRKDSKDEKEDKQNVASSSGPQYNLNIPGQKRENKIKEVNDSIAANIKLAMNPETKNLDIDVDSKDGIVTLSGNVPSEDKKADVQKLVGEAVSAKVENKLNVGNVSENKKEGVSVGTWFTKLFLFSLLLIFAFIGVIVWLAPADGKEGQ